VTYAKYVTPTIHNGNNRVLPSIPYLVERAPWRLLNFSTCRCGPYLRAALIQGRHLFKTAYNHSLFLFCS